jgi:signal peptidase I
MPDNPTPTVSPTKLTWTSPKVRLRVLFSAFLIAFVCYGFFTWVLWPVQVLGDSMLPNYHSGERHFINKLAYRVATPQRGDVVALYAPNGDVYLKRVLGLPGETVTFTNGGLAIDGQELKEPYVDTKIVPREDEEGKLGPNDYSVIGDNRATSVRGKVPREDIIGKVVF